MTELVRVLHLVQGLEIGGLEIVVKRLVEGLDPERYHSTVCCYDVLGELTADVERAGAEVVLLPRRPGVDWCYPLRLARMIRQRRIDLVHLHNDLAFFYGTVAAKLARVHAIIYTEHGRVFPAARWRRRCVNRALAALAVHTVPVSAALRENLIAFEKFRPDRMTVIPNGVPDPARPDQATLQRLRHEMGAGSGQFLLGTVGRLAEVKDHLGLIRAMPELLRRHPQARLAIVGGGELQGELEAEIERLNLATVVKLLGERRPVAPYLHAFDLFVLSSKSEGMPLSLLEAFAAGLPAVAMNVGGVAEVMQDGSEGFLVEPGNYEQFVERLAALIEEPATLGEMTTRARKTYRAHFTVEQMVGSYASLYERILDGNSPRAVLSSQEDSSSLRGATASR